MQHKLTPLQRIWKSLDFTTKSGCWIWTGITNSKGYGAFSVNAKRMTAVHRYLYQQFVGELGPKEHVLHRCDTPRCVNPAHLWLGSHHDNIRDMIDKGRHAWGEATKCNKMTKAQAETVLREYRRKGRYSNSQELADRYGVLPGAITSIVAGRSWPGLNRSADKGQG